MLIVLSLILLFCMAVFAFMRLPKFGKSPYGERLERIKKSPHYKNGEFRNLSHTPNLTEGVSYYSVSKEFFFGEKNRVTPADVLPSMKTDLLTLSPDADVLVWFGHSSKFALANHPWDEPLEKITALNKETNLNLLTPLIGERVNLKDGSQIFSQWWKGLK